MEALIKQKEEFQSWGILADWKNCYKTFDKQYIIEQIRLFWKLYQNVSTGCFFSPVFFNSFLRRGFSIDNINQ
jgi:isoleucyl-tRNA synthetase